MVRKTCCSVVLLLLLVNSASAQLINRNGGNAFGSGPAGLGNAGGFATGGGFANSTTNSMNFGAPVRGAYGYGGGYQAPLQSIPGVNNFGGGFQTNLGGNAVLPGIGTGANMPMGMNGFVPGVAPPGFTADMFGYDVAAGSGESGYTDFGTAMTYSALGLGFGGVPGGMGAFGPMGVGPMGYGSMGYGPMGIAPGMVPGTFLPGDPVAAALNGAVANPGPQPTRPGLTKPGATMTDGNQPAADANQVGRDANADKSPAGTRRGSVRRSFLNDNVPVATANAIRIQNRLHNVKSPNLKNIKVLIANRTAVLSGTVDTAEDEQLVLRMVSLEPGVVDVKSEIVVNGAAAK